MVDGERALVFTAFARSEDFEKYEPVFNDIITNLLKQHQIHEPATLHQQLSGCIYFQSTSQLAISSSQIRQLLSENQPIDFLTPLSVCDYINKQHCYR